MLLPKLSLLLNIFVLAPVCASLFAKSNWIIDSFGEESPARGILLSIYLSILIFSIFLLLNFDLKLVLALLCIQIIYKIISAFMVENLANPVIISNIIIALFHSVSVWKVILSIKS